MCGNSLTTGWIFTRIDEVTVKGVQRTPADSEQFIYVDIGSIDRDAKRITRPQTILGKGAPSRARKVINKGDVIVSLTRPNLNAVALVPGEYDNQIASTGFEVLKPIIVESNYLFSLVRSQSFINSISKKVQGALYPAAKSADVKEYEFPLPPLAEQKQIATKLDELLAQVDTIKTRLDAIPTILKRFRQSVLAAAVSGKLTEEWRGGNKVTNVEFSLVKILKSRSEKVTARTKVPQPHLKDEEYNIHKSWKWVSLDSLSAKIVDGVHHKPVYVEKGIPFMSVKDIKNEKMSFKFCKFISEETHMAIHSRCNPEKGDLLITKSGTIGRTAIVDTNDIFDLFVSVALIKPASQLVNMKFVDIALRQWVNSIDISNRVVGTAIKNLHLRDMRVLAIPFPPIEEQKQIVKRVEPLCTIAEQIEKQVSSAQTRVNNLTQSILAKAFQGELTAEWREQNPELISGKNSGESLLEKIKAEQEVLKITRSKSKRVIRKQVDKKIEQKLQA